MPESGTSGSVGAPGAQAPGATRLAPGRGLVGPHGWERRKQVAAETFRSDPRVRVPTGKAEGRQPEASLAWP